MSLKKTLNPDEKFEVHFELEKNRMHVKLKGFLNSEDIILMLEFLKVANKNLKANASALIDLREFKVFKKIDNLEDKIPQAMNRVRFAAFVFGNSALPKMQIKNLDGHIHADLERKFFDSMNQAENWLDIKQSCFQN